MLVFFIGILVILFCFFIIITFRFITEEKRAAKEFVRYGYDLEQSRGGYFDYCVLKIDNHFLHKFNFSSSSKYQILVLKKDNTVHFAYDGSPDMYLVDIDFHRQYGTFGGGSYSYSNGQGSGSSSVSTGEVPTHSLLTFYNINSGKYIRISVLLNSEKYNFLVSDFLVRSNSPQ